ncbi:MAG: OmpA family protein [Leptonema sp. (in: Bacteria)]|nr:OmpA family protein [Leptonema sp. (in: bacteria)]
METIDIGDLKIKVPLLVRYKYIGPETVKDYYGKERNAHKIVFVYELNHQVVPGNGPISLIQGRSTDEMWFSTEDGIPVFDVQTIVYKFTLKNKQSSESAYRIKSWYEKVRRIGPEEKEALTEQIKKQVEGHYSKNLQVRETEQGISLDLSNILFDVDSDKLRPEAQDTLNKVKDILAQHSNREIRIQGHTDNTGGKNYNIDLSTRRAKSVLDYLANQGLNTDNMSYKGYGETKPVAPNITEEGRAKNRRVEILIVTE